MKKIALKKGPSSIKWRIMLIFFVIVFIAMTVAGVFVTSKIGAYQVNYLRTNCTKTASTLNVTIPFDTYTSLDAEAGTIQAILDEWQTGKDYEIFVIDTDMKIVASDNSAMAGRTLIGSLDEDVAAKALQGDTAESRDTLPSGIQVLNYAEPVEKTSGDIIGVVYLRADLTSALDMENESRVIFIQAMIITLIIAMLLSFFITSSITEPINDLTQKAEKMASGDFSQSIAVRSDDEIGRLADMFNILRQELDNKINEIYNEKNKLETILKYMADGLIAVGADGSIIHINPAARELLEIGDEDMETLDFDAVIRRMGKKDITDGINMGTSRDVMSEVLAYGERSLHIRYARIMDDEGRDVGIIMLIQDITERQRLEKMQTDFVANVSHELRTPLTTIKSYTETLVDGSVNDEKMRQSFLKVIDDEAERMTHLVKDLLQLSSLDHNARLNKRELDLNDLMATCAQKIRFTAEAKEQTVRCDFNVRTPIIVSIDRDKMQQVMLNVLTNSIKYTPEGGTIVLDTRLDGNTAVAVIRDNGIGISREELPRIFERFYRVDKARSRSMGGTGLGLSIARQIVEAHNGSITCESVEGEGTTFTIMLPLSWSRGEKGIE